MKTGPNLHSRTPLGPKFILLALAVAPVLIYWLLLGRAPTMTVPEAKAVLARSDSNVVLVDVRTPEAFNSRRFLRSVNWPYCEIMAPESKIPEALRGRELLMICDSGFLSAYAASKLEGLGATAFNVKGGLEEWQADLTKAPAGFGEFINADGKPEPFAYRPMPLFLQWLVVLAAFGAKPTYMILSLVLALIVWKIESPDIKALKWGLLFFLGGEIFCAVNYIFFQEDSYLTEYLHNLGMAVGFGYWIYALFLGLDLRFIHYSDPDRKCAGLAFCGQCVKYASVTCGLRKLLLVIIPMAAILTLIPQSVPIGIQPYRTHILDTLYSYSHPAVYQYYETRFCALTALVLFLGALAALFRKKGIPSPAAQVLFSWGAGFLGFSFFRFVLNGVFRNDLAWSVCWEEYTELMAVVFIGLFLWLFRRPVFLTGFRREADENLSEKGD